MRSKLTVASLALALAIGLSGCNRDHGYSRSAFGMKFVDQTQAAAIENAGKPDAVESPNPDTRVLVYRRKTFDQESGNAKDALVRVTFKKDAKGAMMYSGIEFQAERVPPTPLAAAIQL